MRAVPPPPPYNPPQDLPLDIVFRDAALIVVDKPAGLLAVPGRGSERQDCLETRLEVRFGPLIAVHRLDMDTSGLMIFARTRDAHSILSGQFRSHAIEKVYTALVSGRVDGETGTIDLPIGRDWEHRPLRRIDRTDGKPAITHWRRLRQDENAALLKLTPKTGRTHQLRLHCASTGHPILGDRLYGDAESAERLCLHACGLSFAHPVNEARVELTTPAPFA